MEGSVALCHPFGCDEPGPEPSYQAQVIHNLVGIAQNAKGGAVLVVDGDGVYYLAGLASWPDEVHGKKVQVTGKTDQRQYIPEARQLPDGAWTQGAKGSQSVIDAPEWKVVP